MLDAGTWSLHTSIALFVAAAATIAGCGVLVTVRAERLAAYTGIGQALMGSLFLGIMTSLSGLVTSITAAYENHPQLAVSNAVGGIAVQTAFLALADLFYRRANLEHAAASESNLVQAALLIVLLSLPLLAQFTSTTALLGVDPFSIALVASYLFGLRLLAGARRAPMWHPLRTRETQPPEKRRHTHRQGQLLLWWFSFLGLAAIVALAGWVVAQAGVAISRHSGLSEGVVGTLFTATSTSLPEAVIAVTAVRRGALTLAVGDIIGGNTFDVLFLAFSDLAYRHGSIYHAMSATESFWLVLSLLMAAILLLGLLRREKHGIANIGFESVLVLALYLTGLLFLVD